MNGMEIQSGITLQLFLILYTVQNWLLNIAGGVEGINPATAESINTEPGSKHLKCKCIFNSNKNKKVLSRQVQCVHLSVKSKCRHRDTAVQLQDTDALQENIKLKLITLPLWHSFFLTPVSYACPMMQAWQ